jgi:adenylate cyclase
VKDADSSAKIDEIASWLVEQAFGDPDMKVLLKEMCERNVAAGIPLVRAMINWTTLHPLYHVEMLIWRNGSGITFDRIPFSPDNLPTAEWLRSPLRALVEGPAPLLRRRLAGPDRQLDFPVLEEFAASGMTDYIAFATALNTPGARARDYPSGVVSSFTTADPAGFTEYQIEQLRRLHKRFALVSKTIILTGIMRTLTRTYLGSHAGERVLSGQIRHGDGDSLPAVIWFSDLRRSTEYISRMPQDEFIRLLNEYFDCTAGAVMLHGGDVLDFIGDGVIAIFPIVGGDPAEAARHALAAVDESHRRLAELNQRRAASGQEPIAFGIGLNEGEVLFGNIGIAERLVFSIIGPTVNALARIEAMTKELDVTTLATKAIVRHAPERWAPAGEHLLRGFEAPVALYALRPTELPETLRTLSAPA